ncbi:partner of bursicon-like [Haliotis asinina]|uniref:partner of bursicon-like n=1 Tax=Haliotis asinina TaxID=109174 RepID=UPI003531F422
MAIGPRDVAVLHVLFAAIFTIVVATVRAPYWQDNCQTLSTEVDIVKNIVAEVNGQRLQVSCVARLTVNKCEGVCESVLSPSVHHYPFKKDCRCCREGEQAQRRIVMQECYGEDGNLMPHLHPTTTIKDLRNCDCFRCEN